MLKKLSMLLVIITLFMGVLVVPNFVSANVNSLNPDHTHLTSSHHSLAATTGFYVGNANTHKFHKPSCSYGKKIKHKIYFNSREEAIQSGYSPCGHCHP